MCTNRTSAFVSGDFVNVEDIYLEAYNVAYLSNERVEHELTQIKTMLGDGSLTVEEAKQRFEPLEIYFDFQSDELVYLFEDIERTINPVKVYEEKPFVFDDIKMIKFITPTGTRPYRKHSKSRKHKK